MTDAQVRRAPNASLQFIEAKVKVATNDSLTWLEQKDDQEQLISFAVKHARAAAQAKGVTEKKTTEEIIARMKSTAQERDNKSRRAQQRKLQAQGGLSAQDLQDLALRDVSDASMRFALLLLNTPDKAVGMWFKHSWCEEDDGDIIEWVGEMVEAPKARKCRGKKLQSFIVSYSRTRPSDGVIEEDDSVMSLEELLADILQGDLSVWLSLMKLMQI